MQTMELLDALDFDLSDLKAIGPDLIAHLNAIRNAQVVFWSDIQQGWFVTRYDDVAAAFRGEFPLSSERLDKLAFASIPESEWATRIPLLTTGTPSFANMTDPPYHSRLRKPMNLAFSPKNIEKLRPRVQARIAEIFAGIADGESFEFIARLARPLTGSVIMGLMGVPDSAAAQLGPWTNAIVNAIGTPRPSPALLEAGEAAMREMNLLFRAEIEQRWAAPGDDFLSVLAQAEQSGALSQAEVLGTCVNALLAGHESTASTMAFGTAALAADPGQVAVLLGEGARIQDAVAEIGRFVAMSACQTRVAAQDFTWAGKHIKKGDVVYLWMAAAGRDPSVFSDPDMFDLTRDASKSLVFGGGIHHCVGHVLAKLQLGEFFPAAFAQFDIEILDDPLDYSGGYSFRTLSTMNVRFHRK
jgi:cytochrome P450